MDGVILGNDSFIQPVNRVYLSSCLSFRSCSSLRLGSKFEWLDNLFFWQSFDRANVRELSFDHVSVLQSFARCHFSCSSQDLDLGHLVGS